MSGFPTGNHCLAELNFLQAECHFSDPNNGVKLSKQFVFKRMLMLHK